MSGINYKKLEFEFGEDWDIFRELISDYKEASVTFLEQIKAAITSKELESLRISAHTLKGIVVNFYCEELTQTAFELEQCGKSGDLASAPAHYDKLVILNSNILAEIIEYDKKRV